jgi:N-acetylglucosaminyl-diphospho-decaprenol L-rhamnosyltransferase
VAITAEHSQTRAEAPELSVVVVNYNGAKFIEQCLESVVGTCGSSTEIVVLDNASSDESIGVIRRQPYPIRLITSNVNLGFARGVNTAIRASRGSVLLLLNPDAQICDPIDPALDQMRSRPDIGVLGLKVSYPDGRPQASYGFDHTPFRIILSWAGFGRLPVVGHFFSLHERRFSHYTTGRDVDWVSGACLLLRRSTWSRIGGFDEKYFMYVEDVDFCKSVRKSGERVSYTPTVHVRHREGGSVVGFNEMAMIRTVRNYLVYCRKWHSGASAEVVRIGLAMVCMARWLLLSLGNMLVKWSTSNVSSKVAAQKHVAAALLFRQLPAE